MFDKDDKDLSQLLLIDVGVKIPNIQLPCSTGSSST